MITADKMTLGELYTALVAASALPYQTRQRDRQFYQNWIDYRERKGFYARPDQQRPGEPWQLQERLPNV